MMWQPLERDQQQLENALRNAAQQWRTAFDAINDAVALLDAEGSVVRCNLALTCLVGKPFGDIIGRPWWELVPGSSTPSPNDPFWRMMETGARQTATSLWDDRCYEVTVDPVRNLHGGLDGGVFIASDITERKRMEVALRQSEERYRGLVESAPDVIYTLSAEHGIITSLNPAFEAITGWPRAECLGQPFVGILHPDDVAIAGDNFRRALGGEKTPSHELRVISKSGKEMVGEFISMPQLADGKVIGVYGIAHDVTKRKQMEMALRESEGRFRRLAENAPDLIYRYRLTPPVGFEYVSPAATAITGYTPEEHYADPDLGFKLVHPDDRVLLREIRAGKVPTEPVVLRWVRKDGAIIWTEQRNTPIYDDTGTPIAIEGIARDVTERKRAEESLREAAGHVRSALKGAVQALAAAVELRDRFTAGHQWRVAELSSAIAAELGLPADQIEGLYVTASLHDIGKLYVPAEILSKPGQLTEIEFSIIKAHSQLGCDILNGIESPWPVSQVILQHHERMDGSGYPQGLRGEDILLEARILGVADVVEAMSSHRPYRPALGVEAALAEVQQNRGVRYDPDVVDACMRLFTEAGFRFE